MTEQIGGVGVIGEVYRDGSNRVLLDTRENGIPAGINLYAAKRR